MGEKGRGLRASEFFARVQYYVPSMTSKAAGMSASQAAR
jgi:hypothetical protein